MSAKVEILKEEFEFVFARLEETLEGIDDKEFTYRLTEASNNIQMILNHLSMFTNINIPSIMRGEPYHTPEDKPIDSDEPKYGLEELMTAINNGKKKIIDEFIGLSDDDLEEIVPLMAGPYPRKIGLYAYIGELFHHRGQIAFIRGTVKRLRERDPDFLK